MLGAGKIIHKVDGRRQIRIVTGHGNVLRRIIAAEPRPLHPRPHGQVEFLFLDPPIKPDLIGVLGEFIGVAEQAVKRIKALEGIYVVIRIVDGRAMRINMTVIQLQDHMFGQRFRIGEGGLNGE